MRVHKQMLARISSVLLLAGAFVVMNAARADATLIVWVCDDAACVGGGDTSVMDGSGSDSDLSANSVVYDFGPASGSRVAADTTDTELGMTYRVTAATFASFSPYIYAIQDGFSPGTVDFAANASLGGGNASFHTGGPVPPPFGAGVINCAMPCGGSSSVLPPYYIAVGVAPVAAPPLGGVPRGARGDATATVTPSVPDGGSTAALLGSVLLGFGILRRKFNL
jgi:hypothetical protein